MQMMEKWSLCCIFLLDVFEELSDSFSLIAIFVLILIGVVAVLGLKCLYLVESQNGDFRRDL